MRWWHDHSLTIVMTAIGVSLTAVAFLFDEGKMFDLVLGLGQGTLTAALLFILQPFFRETSKPEDPP